MPKGIYKRTEFHRKRIKEGLSGGRVFSLEHLRKMSEAQKKRTHYPLSEEHKKKISLAHMGINTWSKGRKLSLETRKKIQEAQLKMKGVIRQKNNGLVLGYRGLHRWVERELGKPNKCTRCGKVRYSHSMHWANKSGKYLQNLSDWLRLCVPCHKEYDYARKGKSKHYA